MKTWLASLKVGDEVVMVVSSGSYVSKDPAVIVDVTKRYLKAKRAVDVSGTRFSNMKLALPSIRRRRTVVCARRYVSGMDTCLAAHSYSSLTLTAWLVA